MKLIKNALIPKEDIFVKKDVLLKNGKIQEIADKLNYKNIKIIDIDGKYLLPSVIDLNVRLLNDTLNKKNIDKLVESSKKGAVSTVVITSDFTPRLDSSTLLDFIKSSIEDLEVDLRITAPLVDISGKKLNNVATLINNGASAIWTNSDIEANLLKRGMQYAHMKNKPLFCFCYEPGLDDEGVINEGLVSSKLGLSGISKSSETVEVAKICELCSELKNRVVFQSLSTKRSLKLIEMTKSINPNIYSEVSIHHLIKNENSCDEFNTYAKILPPLRDEEERIGLLEELKNGNIDILTSLHSPKSVLYKDVAFKEAAFGIGSIEEYFKLAYTFLVKKGYVTLEKLVKMVSSNPAKVLELDSKGEVKEGFDADLFIFNPHKETLFVNSTSIYDNTLLKGDIEYIS